MFPVDEFIRGFYEVFPDQQHLSPWEITRILPSIIEKMISTLGEDFTIADGIAIHKSSTIEHGAVLKPPLIVSENCFVAATSYLRGGIYLGNSAIVGPGCEVKTSILFHHSVAAHLNFIGDSIVGSEVNFEAGSITANHYNEREWRPIPVLYKNELIQTDSTRFGSLIGDHSRIGANAVLSPGCLLLPNTIIKRLSLLDPVSEFNGMK